METLVQIGRRALPKPWDVSVEMGLVVTEFQQPCGSACVSGCWFLNEGIGKLSATPDVLGVRMEPAKVEIRHLMTATCSGSLEDLPHPSSSHPRIWTSCVEQPGLSAFLHGTSFFFLSLGSLKRKNNSPSFSALSP